MKQAWGIWLAVVAATSPMACFAQSAPFQTYPERLAGICNDIYAKTQDNSNPEQFGYAYERKIYEAAGVDFKIDTSTIARLKIQNLWTKHPDRLQCSSVNFSVTNGGILKYAVEMKTYGAIDNAIKTWRIDVNMIDGGGGTLLDFVSFKIEQNHGNANEPVLLNYYDRLLRYGAKRCVELPDTTKCPR